jgi:hypothetical protein
VWIGTEQTRLCLSIEFHLPDLSDKCPGGSGTSHRQAEGSARLFVLVRSQRP